MSTQSRDRDRDMLAPKEVADRCGFSYQAVLQAIRRGELQALPIHGRLRIEVEEYERWRRTSRRAETPTDRLSRVKASGSGPGSLARLTAIEAKMTFERAGAEAKRNGPSAGVDPRVHQAMIDAMRSEVEVLCEQAED